MLDTGYNIENEDLTEEEAERMRVITALADNLLTKRDEAVEFRVSSGVERRWAEDENLLDGVDSTTRKHGMIDYAAGEAPPRTSNEPNRSKVVVNIVRAKCET